MKEFIRALMLTIGLTTGAAAMAADEPPPTPTSLEGGKVITAEEGKKLADAKNVVFIDTRNVLNYGKGHVPTAVAAAYKEKSEKVASFDASQDQFDLGKLPTDKSAQVVFYSDGPTGWKSYKAAVLAIKSGYKNVMYMRGGFAEWVARGYSEAK
jgi:rhodanese-related sulfurtransferase